MGKKQTGHGGDIDCEANGQGGEGTMARGGDSCGIDDVDEHKCQDCLPGPCLNNGQGWIWIVAPWGCRLLAPGMRTSRR